MCVMMVWRMGAIGVWLAGGAAVAAAQSPSARPDVPAAYDPPAGMCRVWLRDVPAMQQPAPTDCRSALRTKPVGATVIYGPEPKRSTFTPNDWTKPLQRSARPDDASGGSEADADVMRTDDLASSMPAMRSAVLWIEGQRPAELQRWFGTMNVAARFAMPARGGSPDRVQWFDIDNRLVQIWTDRDGDGRADRVELYNRDGARVRVIGQ
jgi:hypothetical protein